MTKTNKKSVLRIVILILLTASCLNLLSQNSERLFIDGDSITIKEKIFRVENGLIDETLISNQPIKTYSIYDRMKYFDVPGVSIAVIKNNKIEWAKSYGLKNKNTSDSVSINTLFQAASLSKPVTAIIVLKLTDKGIIQLDSNVNMQLSTWKIPENEFTKNGPVTPKHLILHTSGLNIPSYPGYKIGNTLPNIADVLSGLNNSNTEASVIQFKPGKKWSYSGAGYSVLQLLLTEKTKMTFPELMKSELFQPLNITNSTFEQEGTYITMSNKAFGHLENGIMVENGYHLYPEMAAAGLWTTPMDYAKIVCEIQKSYQGESCLILNQKTAINALSRHWGDMGLGFILDNKGDSLSLTFSGGNHGYICDIYSYLHLGSGAVIMTNSDNGSYLIEAIYRSLSKEYNWTFWIPETITPIKADSSVIKKLNGNYTGLSRDKKEFSFNVKGTQDSLVYKTREREYPMYAVSDSCFVIPEQNWKLWIFKKDSQIDSVRFKLEYGRGIAKRKR